MTVGFFNWGCRASKGPKSEQADTATHTNLQLLLPDALSQGRETLNPNPDSQQQMGRLSGFLSSGLLPTNEEEIDT